MKRLTKPAPKWVPVAAILSAFSVATPALASASWVETSTHAYQFPGTVFGENVRDSQSLDIVVALKVRNKAQLDATVRALVTPGSPAHGQWLTTEQTIRDYAPTTAQAKAVADYLIAAGFRSVTIEPNRMLISASGSAAAVRKAFDTQLAQAARGNLKGFANLSAARVPAELADSVTAVLGLSTLDRPHTMIEHAALPAAGTRSARGTTPAAGTAVGHNPTEYPAIYGAVTTPTASTTEVGIIVADNVASTISDLRQFERENNLPFIDVKIVHAAKPYYASVGADEWDLDSQSIQGMAVDLKTMFFYNAGEFLLSNITLAVNRAVADNRAKLVNMSLGVCETIAQNIGMLPAEDPLYEIAMAQGQTFSVSSGDAGSQECGPYVNGAAYPSSSPYVISVGGTTLLTDENNAYAGETAWYLGGGSPSVLEPRQDWQADVVPGSYRGLPDVALNADPYSGSIIIVHGHPLQVGGTSLSSPLFVGAWARIQTAHDNKLGFPAPWIYKYGFGGATTVFNDVTSGSNGNYTATTGWDYTTGFGSLNVDAVNAVVQ